jgi:hypothetical protein
MGHGDSCDENVKSVDRGYHGQKAAHVLCLLSSECLCFDLQNYLISQQED